MSHGYDRQFRRPRVVIRETDDYIGAGHQESPPEPENPWIRNFFHPATFTVLVACVLWPVARFVGQLSPILGRTVIWLIPVFMALVGFTTQRIAIKRLLSGTEALRFRLIELGVLFLVAKVAGHISDTLPQLVSVAQTWSQNPLSFFDAETMTAFLLGTAVWWGGGATARDLDAVRDPSLYTGETEPRRRLMKRYFLGGVVLMIFAALDRVELRSVITMTQERTSAPIFSALIYFLLGLVMLGQIRFARLTALWHRDRVTVSHDLNVVWLRYLLSFLALIAGVAFVLPTGYTLGFSDLVVLIITLITSLLMILYLLIAWPLALLAALLMGKSEPVPPPAMERLPFEPEMISAHGGSDPWWALLRSALFWVVLLGTLFYLLRSYIRDRPELRQLLQRLTPLRWAGHLWHALLRWLRSLRQKAGRLLPDLVARVRQARVSRSSRQPRAVSLGSRDQILHHYLRTLDTAQEAGVPRRRTETPYEYRRSLQEYVEEEEEALVELTEAFIEARYSTHPVSPEDVAAQQSNAQRLQDTLRKRHDD
ncbi:MAG: DUF4129 domain-containing protein [Anaerolineae bacterium]|nr:DUF4129 domain-containing protein [Anaerolineae bacterium]